MSQKKIPGFTSLHLKILYIPQEVFEKGLENSDDRPMDVIIGYTQRNKVDSSDAASGRIEVLEEVMESLDLECPDTGPDNMVQMEAICGEISALEDEMRRQDNVGADGDLVMVVFWCVLPRVYP